MGKRLGQHFLRDKKVLARIAQEALSTDDSRPLTNNVVIEIGPGHGELTDALLVGGAEKIIVVERDSMLADALRSKYRANTRIKIIEGDVRNALPALSAGDEPKKSTYTVVGNIPYYLTGYLLRLLGDLVASRKLSVARVVLLVQSEVAERACAAPPHMNLLAAALQGWAKPEVAFAVPRGAFSPPPKVTSKLLILTPLSNTDSKVFPRYFEVVRMVFRHPRKTLANNLREGLSLAKEDLEKLVGALGLKKGARAAELTPEHIKTLLKAVEK